jgi:hypothetical protein
MPDTSRPVASQYDPQRHTLTIAEAEAQLLAAGVPRTRRHVQRLCLNGSFDAARLGPNSDWFIAPNSVEKVIGDLRALDEQRARRVATQRDTSHDVAPETPNKSDTDTSRQDATQRDTSRPEIKQEQPTTRSDTSRPVATDSTSYVAQLEKRLDEKDDTIKFLQEELVDRRTQISGMKAIIDGQRQLLETINQNVAPVFGALAMLVQGKSKAEAAEAAHATAREVTDAIPS